MGIDESKFGYNPLGETVAIKGGKNMKRSYLLKFLLVLVAVLLTINLIVSLLQIPSSSYAAGRVQYKVVTIRNFDSKNLQEELNKYGNDGWELVPLATFHATLIFKK